MVGMTIREARPDDAPSIAEVHVRSWQAAYRGIIPDELLDGLDPERLTRMWKARLREGRAGDGVLVAQERDGVVAFAGFETTDAPRGTEGEGTRVVDLGAFYSLPSVWGSGINQRLVTAVHSVMDGCPEDRAVLWVLSANTRARRFYEAQGWEDTGTVVERGMFGGTIVRPTALYHRPIRRPGSLP